MAVVDTVINYGIFYWVIAGLVLSIGVAFFWDETVLYNESMALNVLVNSPGTIVGILFGLWCRHILKRGRENGKLKLKGGVVKNFLFTAFLFIAFVRGGVFLGREVVLSALYYFWLS